MVKIFDQRQKHDIRFEEIDKGQIFWSSTYLCFMLKIEECGCDECNGFVTAVSLLDGRIYNIEPTEIVEPCQAEIKIFN